MGWSESVQAHAFDLPARWRHLRSGAEVKEPGAEVNDSVEAGVEGREEPRVPVAVERPLRARRRGAGVGALCGSARRGRAGGWVGG